MAANLPGEVAVTDDNRDHGHERREELCSLRTQLCLLTVVGISGDHLLISG